MADILVSLIIWYLKTFALNLATTDYPLLSYSTFNSTLNTIKPTLIYTLSYIDKFISVEAVILFVVLIITAEIGLFLMKAGFFAVNLLRGSGA